MLTYLYYVCMLPVYHSLTNKHEISSQPPECVL